MASCWIPDWASQAGYQCGDPYGPNYMPGATQYSPPIDAPAPSVASDIGGFLLGGEAEYYNLLTGSSVTPQQFADVAGQTFDNLGSAAASTVGSAASSVVSGVKEAAASVGSFFASPIVWLSILLILVAVILGLWRI